VRRHHIGCADDLSLVCWLECQIPHIALITITLRLHVRARLRVNQVSKWLRQASKVIRDVHMPTHAYSWSHTHTHTHTHTQCSVAGSPLLHSPCTVVDVLRWAHTGQPSVIDSQGQRLDTRPWPCHHGCSSHAGPGSDRCPQDDFLIEAF